jgi:hypothetical protein
MLRRTLLALAAACVAGCHGIPGSAPAPALNVLYLPEPSLGDTALITLDTATLRPSSRRGSGLALATNFQNGRYRGETLRAISEDSTVTDGVARQLILQGGPAGPLFLDFQEVATDQLASFARLLRSITTLAKSSARGPVAIIVPPQDTVSYPTEVLARLVDMMVVRAFGEHRPGTVAGAPTTAAFITRSVATRSVVMGPARVIAALPLYGYRWDKNGTARPVTYSEASASLNSESGSFRRDPLTQYLVGSGRDGWTAWVPDGQTVAYLLSIVKPTGVAGVALMGTRGAAPDIADAVAKAVRR